MPHYFASDVHLRLDKPDRSERFARFVERLNADDVLIIVGDLYDFWFVSRQQRVSRQPCPTEIALIQFRKRGGQLRILSGNHDTWLEAFIEKTYGVVYEPTLLELQIGDYQLRVRHGHRLSRRWGLKLFMESRLFLRVFSRLPNRFALTCDRMLENSNVTHFERQKEEQLSIYRKAVREYRGSAGVHVFGHLHARVEEQIGAARFFVLGDWRTTSGFLVVDGDRLSLVIDSLP